MAQGGVAQGEVTQRLPGRRVVAPALVGRAAELAEVARTVTAPPAVVIVDGEAGIGKTRLVTELAARPELTGHRILAGGCRQIRESFPLGPVIEALRGIPTGPAWSPVVGTLRPLLPELADRLPPAPAPLHDPAAERHRVFRAAVTVLDSLGPAVLVLEDLHWADEQTADFVGYLLAEAPAALAVVLTFRGDEVDPRLRSSMARLPDATSRTEIVLRPLDARETGALAAALVGAEQVPDDFAGYLRALTAGLPLAIEELLALLRSRGELPRQPAGWTRRALAELAVPTGIRDPLLARLSQLSAPARSAAEAAAVLQVPVPVETLVASSRLSPDRAQPAVEEAIDAGMLVETGEAIGFRHLLAAQAVYDQIPGPRRRDLHGRAAAALGSLVPVPLGQVAHHLRQSGRHEEWFAAAQRAAEQAFALGHYPEAFRLLEEMLRDARPDPLVRGRLAVRLGQAAIETLRSREALDLLLPILDQDLPGQVRGELRLQVGLMLYHVGDDPPRMRRLLAGAVADLGDRPDLQAWAMVTLGVPAADGVALAEHRRWLQRALEVAPLVDDPDFEVFLLGKVAMVMAPIGDPTWQKLAHRIEERTDGRHQHRWHLNALWSVGMAAAYAGHHQTGERLLRAGLAGALASENRRLELSIRSALVMLRYLGGSWHGLDAELTELGDALAEAPRARVEVEIAAGGLALVRGNLDDARQRLDWAMERCLQLGGFDVLPVAMSALIRLSLARGELAAAATVADQWVATVESNGVWAPYARALPAVVESMVAGGGLDRARSLVTRSASRLRTLDAPLAPAAIGYARGLLRRAAGRPREAARSFTAAAGDYQRLGAPYEAALAAEQAALCRLEAGDAASAEAELRGALTAFRRLGATWDAGRATSTARRAGVSVPAPHRGGRRGYGNALSPRERTVAGLAATGRSNKEIAAELYLSPSTVARHVSAALRKLGARSRAALAHRLDQPDGR